MQQASINEEQVTAAVSDSWNLVQKKKPKKSASKQTAYVSLHRKRNPRTTNKNNKQTHDNNIAITTRTSNETLKPIVNIISPTPSSIKPSTQLRKTFSAVLTEEKSRNYSNPSPSDLAPAVEPSGDMVGSNNNWSEITYLNNLVDQHMRGIDRSFEQLLRVFCENPKLVHSIRYNHIVEKMSSHQMQLSKLGSSYINEQKAYYPTLTPYQPVFEARPEIVSDDFLTSSNSSLIIDRRRPSTTLDFYSNDLEDSPKKKPRVRTKSEGFILIPPKNTTNTFELDLKQMKAQNLRKSLANAKSEKLQKESEKIHLAKLSKTEQIKKLKESMEEKQVKAEKLRETHLKHIVSKAADEHQKLNEMASNSTKSIENKKIELQNRHDSASASRKLQQSKKHATHEQRIILEEQASERRRMQEQGRLKKIKEESEKKHELAEERFEREKKREAQGRVLDRIEKERRLEKFQSDKQAEEVEKQQKIKNKLELGNKRREETIELVKEKAAAANQQAKIIASRVNEIRKTPETRNKCIVCHIEVKRGADMIEHNRVHEGKILEADDILNGFKFKDNDRSKPLKKKLKKIRQKVRELHQSYHFSLPSTSTVNSNTAKNRKIASKSTMNKLEGSQRVFQNITNKLCVSIEKFGVSLELLDGICVHWKKDAKNKRIDNNQFDLQDFETCLDIISKHFVKNEIEDYSSFYSCGTLDMIMKITCTVDSSNNSLFSLRIISKCLSIISNFTNKSFPSLHPKTLILSGNFGTETKGNISVNYLVELVELLDRMLDGCGGLTESHFLTQVECICSLFDILSGILSDDQIPRPGKQEIIGYMLLLNIIDSIGSLLLIVHGPIPSNSSLLPFLKSSTTFLETLTSTISEHYASDTDVNKYFSVITSSDLVAAIVTCLDAIVLYPKPHSGSSALVEERLSRELLLISIDGIKCLNHISFLDYKSLQDILGSDGMQTAFFHLVSFWLNYWTSTYQDDTSADKIENILLAEMLKLVGITVFENERNTSMLRFGGSAPSILQILVKKLPFEYYCDERLQDLLFPTLIAASYNDEDNRSIMEEDISLLHLSAYLNNKKSQGKQRGSLIWKKLVESDVEINT